ncbi:c-type cytochrome [Arenibaculum pallidiluteum]|uniref:c-type cytochrome n=1 Tax=Arenibaculum pallidiluteum TaxID=2812559 RepID=UPI001A96D5C2|nr:cytochrome c [Arenibaculum pallidiluteum]
MNGFRTILLGSALAALCHAAPVHAAEVAAGKAKAAMCAVCHGMDGMAKQPDAANIGGESPAYLERQLRAFRSGERKHEQMSVIAQGLSDEDIANLAAYYAAIKIEVVEVP